MRVRMTTFVVLILLCGTAFGSGFQINEHGARAMAMGGAFTAVANDPSAVYFNPAGITQLNGTYFSIGATYIAPMSTFTGPNPSTTESKLKKKFFTPATLYFTQSLGGNLYAGLAFNSPFGLGTEWEDNWVGRYRTTETEIRTFNLTPVVAYKINDQFSVAAGFTISYADVLIARKLQVTPLPDANLELKGDKLSYGFSLGVMAKPVEKLSLGLAMKSQIKYDFEGTATTTIDPKAPAAIVARLPKGNITAPLTTPMVITFGAAYNASADLLLSADFQYNGWSSYDKLEITFTDLPKGATNPSLSKRDFENSFIVRAGGEYLLNEQVALRAGIYFDKNPVKDERLDPTLPDADRIGLNIGMGYKFSEKFSADISYLYLSFAKREINSSEEFIPILPTPQRLNGKYDSNAHLIGFNLNYNL